MATTPDPERWSGHIHPRHAKPMLRTALWSSAIVLAFAAVGHFVAGEFVVYVIPVVALFAAIGLGLYYVDQGRVRLVGWIMVIALQVLTVGAATQIGGVDAPSLTDWPIIVTLACVSLGWREGAATAVVGALVFLAFLAADQLGWRPALPPTITDRTVTWVGTLALVAVWTGLAVQLLSRSLERARAQEAVARAAVAEHDRELERRRALEVELREAIARAESANEAKSRFLANMSHELRTPLNAIIGYSEILMDDTDGEPLDDLERIRTSGRHLLGLINDVLDLSKIEAGRLQLVAEEIDVPALVTELERTVRPLADARGNQLEAVVDVDPGDRLLGDPMRVRQIMLNLLSNAIKFTEGGTVTLTARCDERCVVLEVADTGIGIAEAQISRLFRPFVQADDSTSRRYGGTGLGLALSQRLAEMMEGRITVTSEEGSGSTFTFALPLRSARNEVLRLTEARVERALSGEGPVLLCVDDDPSTLLLLDRLLAQHTVIVVPCLDPERVVPLAVQLAPIAVTLDLHMPSLDGRQVLRRLRAHPETARIPAVMISIDRSDDRRLPVSEWLTKPVDRADLLATLDRLAPAGDRSASDLVC